jgi:hypothetical protein
MRLVAPFYSAATGCPGSELFERFERWNDWNANGGMPVRQ